jgi:hypothetical protein
MGSKAKDGASTERHIEIAKKSAFASQVISDQTFDDVPEETVCPFELEHVWEWFNELDATRQNGMGHGPITHTEITNWDKGMQYRVSPFERQAIRALDRAFMIYSHSKE